MTSMTPSGPHCETALRVLSSRAAAVVCPGCQGRFPNLEKDRETPGHEGTLALLAEAEPTTSRVPGLLEFVGVLAPPFVLMLLIPALILNWFLGLAFVGALIRVGLISTADDLANPRPPGHRNAGRVMTGMLALIGFLALGFLALMILFFIACAAGL